MVVVVRGWLGVGNGVSSGIFGGKGIIVVVIK